MKALAPLVMALALALPVKGGTATEPVEEPLFVEAGELSLDDFKWDKRPVVVFADNPADPMYRRQMEALEARPDELRERDVVVITDTDPGANSAVRQALRPRGFMLVLVAKDGQVLLRKPQPWDVRELSRSIDKLPTRQQEVRDRRAAPIR
ncbi:DUF4174 domain-containing protein [Pseudooceanicola sp. LIPI14-2-Ac024]|uniref:DUF4174 domain-containing protein n=1 Tax=Pseudooceanicola sp. LIPI14-2-Ac024 TaxID=3344875 RepID=UPI0035CF8EE2